ncbi:MAG: hypothetical protein KDC79_07530 [Cyclobacteriaceae bacterium]|nr:hypothetical protein [Cyclobacteriaceae bacterium]
MKPKQYVTPITLFIGLVLLCASFTTRAKTDNLAGFQFEEGKYQSSFRFELAGNLIILPVIIEGKKLNLIFDTGMNSIMIFNKKHFDNWGSLEKHPVKFSGLGKGRYISGKRLDGISVKMPNIKGKGLSIVVTPWIRFPDKKEGIQIDGVFGYQLLAKFIVQIDYGRKLITLTDPEYFTKPLMASQLDLQITNTKPYVQCPVSVNQKEYLLNLLVDTGAEAELLINAQAIEKRTNDGYAHPIGQGLAGTLMGYKTTIDRLALGDRYETTHVEALLPTSYSFPNESKMLIRDGTIGGETLKRFIVTFDYFNNKLYLENRYTSSVVNDKKLTIKN